MLEVDPARGIAFGIDTEVRAEAVGDRRGRPYRVLAGQGGVGADHLRDIGIDAGIDGLRAVLDELDVQRWAPIGHPGLQQIHERRWIAEPRPRRVMRQIEGRALEHAQAKGAAHAISRVGSEVAHVSGLGNVVADEPVSLPNDGSAPVTCLPALPGRTVEGTIEGRATDNDRTDHDAGE